MADLVDVEDVEIVQTGIEYKLASGPKTFTTDDLSDAVESQNDAAIKAPRLKLGHAANLGLLEDGQPAIGTISDLRLEQNGHVVMGNYKGIPEWLAKVLPSAYPARSIEALTGVKTNTGNTWRLVITDLALLGVVWPGVSTLDDIKALYSKDGPENITVYTTKEEFQTARVTAQINNDDILRQYREQKSPDQMWWWVHSMMRDPDELIVEDEAKGQLYRIPYTIAGDDITFNDPIPVKVVYKDKAKPKKQETRAQLSMALAASNREEFNRMTIASGLDPVALRNALGLEDNATDDEVTTALEAAGFITMPGREVPSNTSERAVGSEQSGTNDAGVTPAMSSQQPQPDVENSGESQNNPEVARPTVQPTQPVAASGIRQVDEATYQQLVADARAGRMAYTRQQQGDRDAIITAAVKAGKIMPSRIPHWQRQWQADEDGTKTLLTASVDEGGLAPGLIPVDEQGINASVEDTSAASYPKEWLPDVHNRVESQGGVSSDVR